MADHGPDPNVDLTDACVLSGTQTRQPTVFLFPGLSGEEGELAALRAGCAGELNVVAISFPDWSQVHRDRIDLDGVIAHCVAQILTHARAEPVLLAGYSFGGHMAFAAAGALEAAGHAVGLLGLLDTHAVPPLEKGRLSPGQHISRLAEAVRNGEMLGRVGHIAARRLIRLRYKWPLAFAARSRRMPLPFRMNRHIDIALQMEFRLVILQQLLDRMAMPEAPLRSEAVLFRSVEQLPDATDDLGWRRHLARLKIITTQGNHFTFMKPETIGPLCQAFVSAMSRAANGGRDRD